MRAPELRFYLSHPPAGVRTNKKKLAPPRWKGGLTAVVADLARRHGPALRRAMSGDLPDGDAALPTLAAQAAMLAEQETKISGLHAGLASAKLATSQLGDAHRKLKGSKKEARKEDKKARLANFKAKLKEAKKRIKSQFEEKVEMQVARQTQRAEAEFDEAMLDEQAKTAKARSRKREVVGVAALAESRLTANKRLKAEMKTMKEELEEMKEELHKLRGNENEIEKQADILEKIKAMPEWGLVRAVGTGRGAKTLEPFYRVKIWEPCGHRVQGHCGSAEARSAVD